MEYDWETPEHRRLHQAVSQVLAQAKDLIRTASDATGIEIDEIPLTDSEAVICRLLRGETLDLSGVYNPAIWQAAPPL